MLFPSSLRLVISGMDSVRPDLFAVWRRKVGSRVRWFNAYGPSETTCTAANYEADLASDETMANIPIGRPLANVRIYIFDTHARPVPVGVPGEIHIGGHGVARGYLNRPGLTAEKFVRDPFSDRPEERLYRTGDVGRYRPDGNIEFLGRIDDQIKIRGFRVEPGEVEAALRGLPGIREACVVVRGEVPDARQLIAYVVAAVGSRPEASDLRALLRRILPEYMVPAAIVRLEAMPVTPTGKIDYAALPKPILGAEPEKPPYELPRNSLERELAALWERLLQTRVGVLDNFFDLGGDSLRGVQLLDKVLADFGVHIPIDTLFDDAATVAAMASRIEAERAGSRGY
jgi:acyl-CoA synthetase (AMP-forming)/AMP-acid ligase II/acyl carrier protein